ncbi:MAG TPA: hypothetical protein VEI07_02180 [Planctomycetaceae bacterium]|nr:hypothetical protein [Planctomycetaceae bacterium]
MLKTAATAGFAVLTLALAGIATAGEKHHKAAKTDSPAFERFKELAGEWVSVPDKAEHAAAHLGAVFKVTSAGSAVEETMMPGTPHEMINMIHPDGDDIVLTHYCAEGNQPEMKAPDKVEGKDVAFKFVRGGNMKSINDSHMHSVTYTFIDKDNFKTTWVNWDNGKPAGTVVFEYKRKK